MGQRLNILTFLEDITLSPYVRGTNMITAHPVDSEDQLIIDQHKYYDFDINRLDKEFTYVEDEDSTLIENAAKVLERTVDTFVLQKVDEVKAGHRVGSDVTKTATISATNTLTITAGFASTPMLAGRGVYNVAKKTWYQIIAFTTSCICTLKDWDDTAYSGGASAGGSWIFEAADALVATKTNIYGYICELAEALNEDEIPDTDRHIVVPSWVYTLLIQASELTPDIAIYHEEKVINGKVGRVAGFDVHLAPGTRVNTETEAVSENTGYEVLACHTGFITFADKFSESRVVDAELQFAKLYQGLFLYGAKVPIERRKAGALLYCRAS